MLYHRQLGLPRTVSELAGKTFHFHFSRHALSACLNDPKGAIVPPSVITLTLEQIVEIETSERGIEKVVIRVPDGKHKVLDIVIAFIPPHPKVAAAGRPCTALVKTCWYNRRDDLHETLDESRYSRLN